MKNFKIEICKRGIEVLVATVSAEMANGNRISQDVDLGGNATTAMYAGAVRAIQALNELNDVVGGVRRSCVIQVK